MTPLTAELMTAYDDVPPTLIETVQAAAAGPGDEELAADDVARADVAALAEAVRRAGTSAA